MQEASVEAVARAHRIDRSHSYRGAMKFLTPPSYHRSPGTKLHGQNRHTNRQLAHCLRKVVASGHLLRFALIGKENIHVLQGLRKVAAPFRLGIVIWIKRGAQAALLGLLEKFSNTRPQCLVKEK